MPERGLAHWEAKLEDAGNRDHRFRMVAVLKQRELERCCTVDEEPADQAMLHLGNPVATAILTNEKERGFFDFVTH